MEKTVKKQIQDRVYSLLTEGIGKFPRTKIENNTQIANCKLCPLSQTRKKVVVSSMISKKKFFILSEFPEIEDESSSQQFLFDEKSSSGIIIKLLEKLGLFQHCYFSFALKCVPTKGIPSNALTLCAQHNLKRELQDVHPDIILCFGYRSLLALSQFDPTLLSIPLLENSSLFQFNFENTPKKVFFLSNSRDLQAFPHWRKQVWRFLEHLKV
jgi:uracil-DNA glycosylase